jgi:hypothetical protein
MNSRTQKGGIRMDKLTIGFLADVLFIQGVICFEEFEAIQNAKSPSDLEDIIEGMLRGDFNVYKRGEARPNTD